MSDVNAGTAEKRVIYEAEEGMTSKGGALVLSEVFPPRIGGSGHWLHEIYTRFMDYKNVFLVGEYPGAEDFDAQSQLNIIRTNMRTRNWTFMTFSGIALFLRIVFGTLKAMRVNNSKEIHCGRVMPEGVVGAISAAIRRVPLVCYIHGEDIEISRHSREHRWMTQFVISRADRLICNCDHSRQLLLKSWKCDPGKVRVLYPRTDINLFKPSSDTESLRSELGWSGRKVILTVSRLNERKGHDRLIQALPEILKVVPDALYVIAGDGMEGKFGQSLLAGVKSMGLESHVHFAGTCSIETLIRFYQACDLFVLPNRQIGGNLEGFGIVLLEAQACGKPVIAGDSGGTVETMIPGETGLIVDCTLAENLVAPVTMLLSDDDLSHGMGNSARLLMTKKYNWDTFRDDCRDTVFIK